MTAFTIVPHASNNHPQTCRKIYVGGAGDVTIVNDDGTTALFKAVPVGTTLVVDSKRVNAVGTTATLMVGWD